MKGWSFERYEHEITRYMNDVDTGLPADIVPVIARFCEKYDMGPDWTDAVTFASRIAKIIKEYESSLP